MHLQTLIAANRVKKRARFAGEFLLWRDLMASGYMLVGRITETWHQFIRGFFMPGRFDLVLIVIPTCQPEDVLVWYGMDYSPALIHSNRAHFQLSQSMFRCARLCVPLSLQRAC